MVRLEEKLTAFKKKHGYGYKLPSPPRVVKRITRTKLKFTKKRALKFARNMGYNL